ncbi:MAG: LuxR C-terminal-related transcriptional regulator [Spirochaetaceae bacterium]
MILSTKLHIPQTMSKVILRKHIIDKLNDGLNVKLTLLSASAGFGKTTILSQWITVCKRPVAWISLDEEHSDVSHFLIYLIAAIQTLYPDFAVGMMAMLRSPQPPSPESILISIINELTVLEDKTILILDDYHLVDSTDVDNILNFLIENIPEQLHLVIATREDPVLPLPRYRVRGQLNEIRSKDLRFTLSEITSFLNKVMKLNLKEDDLVILESRTEGWIAGLQLAAISIKGHHDTHEFINTFSGSHRYILDYLVEEVLRQQTEDIQNFLLQTSIMDRFCGSLCDSVFQNDKVSGQETLELIEHSNLFIIPLDDQRKWFRYHHLFADLLRQRLNRSESVDISELHKKASVWFENNDLEMEAFKHAIAANDIDRAEKLIEGNGMPFIFRGEMVPVYNWLESLPESVFINRPSLVIIHALVLTFLGKASGIVSKLSLAEEMIKKTDEIDKYKDLVGQIAAIRAMLAIPVHDAKKILTQSKIALENLDPDNFAVRPLAKWTLGFAYQNLGQRELAIDEYRGVIPISKSTGNVMSTIAASTCLGQVLESQNRLLQAEEVFKSIIKDIGTPPWPSTCEAFLGLARIYYWWNDLEKAKKYGEESLTLALQLENIDTPISCLILLAKLKLVQKDTVAALSLLNEAEQYVLSHNLQFRMNDIVEARVLFHISRGDIPQAETEIKMYDIPVSSIRLLIDQGKYNEALDIINRLLKDIDSKKWYFEKLNLLILQAFSFYGLGERDNTNRVFKELITLAENGNYIRIFVDEGKSMFNMISDISSDGLSSEYVFRIITAFKNSGNKELQQPLIHPLSLREIEVLELIAQGLSNNDICEKLFLALDTVKGHNRKIFSKLNVKNRTMAIQKARSLNIIKL